MELYYILPAMIVLELAATVSSYKLIVNPVTELQTENDLTCYTCADMGDNHECNRWAPDKHCPIGHTVCETVHRFHRHSGKSVMVEKRCARPTECNIESIGCEKLHSKQHRHQMECRSCCTDSYCNREIPHNKTTALQLSASMFIQTTSGTSRASVSPIIALVVVTWFVITFT